MEVVPGPAAAAALARRGTAPLKSEETPLVEMSEVGLRARRRSLESEGEAEGPVLGHNRAGTRVEGQWRQRRVVETQEAIGRAAAVRLGTLAEARAVLGPSKRMGGSFEEVGR